MKYFRAQEDPAATRIPKSFMEGFLEVSCHQMGRWKEIKTNVNRGVIKRVGFCGLVYRIKAMAFEPAPL